MHLCQLQAEQIGHGLVTRIASIAAGIFVMATDVRLEGVLAKVART